MFTEILVLVAHNAKGSAHFVTVEISVYFFMNVKFRSFWAELICGENMNIIVIAIALINV